MFWKIIFSCTVSWDIRNVLHFRLCLVQFSRSVISDSSRPHGVQHARRPCPLPAPGVILKLMSIKSVMPSNHLIVCHPLLLLPSIFPSSRVFSKESVLCIRWPKFKTLTFKSICAHINQKDLAWTPAVYYTFLFWEIYLVTLTGL